MSQPDASLRQDDSSWVRCDAVLNSFENAWQDGTVPRLEDFLPPIVDVSRPQLLVELIKLDLEYRWRRGERPRTSDYVSRFPELRTVQEVLDELVRFESRLEFSKPTDSTLGARPATSDTSRPGGSTRLPIGARLGRYEIRGEVGRGGFANVYRAWDPELHREVAIKVPRAEFAGHDELMERVAREARSAAQLRHPSIVPIHEVGRHGDAVYIVYDFIPGPTLAAVLRESRPASRQVAEWVAQIAEALDYAHDCGVVHRDIKPSNVMLDHNNQPILADFGLARHDDATNTLTREGDILGTPAYMPPEQAAGRGHAADARSDVYSLGVLMYELLCGRPPFEGSGVSILHRVIHHEPIAPRGVRPSVPVDLDTICLKAMSKEPSRRYATAGLMGEDLRRYLDHRPIRARRIGPVGQFIRWCRRNPALAMTIGAAILVAVIGFWRVLSERDRYRAERDRAESNLYQALVSDAKAQLRGRDTGWWWKAMEDIGQAAKLNVTARDPRELRELAIQCMGSKYYSLRLAQTWSGHTGAVYSIAISPKGRFVASASQDKTVRLWSFPEGNAMGVLKGHTERVWKVAVHPDGRHVASCSDDGTVRLWDIGSDLTSRPDLLENAPPPQVFDFKSGPLQSVAISHDGKWLAAGGIDKTVRIVELSKPGGQPSNIRTLVGHQGPITALCFSSDNRTLATAADDRTIRIWNVTNGVATSVWQLTDSTLSLSFNVAGNLLAYGRPQGFGFEYRELRNETAVGHLHGHTSQVLDVAVDSIDEFLTASADGSIKLWANRPVELAVGQANFGSVWSATFTPDQRWILASYGDGTIGLWERTTIHMIPGTRAQSVVFEGERLHDGATVWCPPTIQRAALARFTPEDCLAIVAHRDNKRIAIAGNDRQIQIWNIDPCTEIRSWPAHARVTTLADGPNENELASAGDDGFVRVWKWDTGEEIRAIQAGIGPIHRVVWTRDGLHMVATGNDGTAMWPCDSQKVTRISSFGSAQMALAAGDGILAVSGPNGAVELRDASNGELRRTLSEHTGLVLFAEFSPDGQMLATAGADQTVRFWDVASGTQRSIDKVRDPCPTWLAFDRPGRYLFSGGSWTMGWPAHYAWDVASGTRLNYIMHGNNGCVTHDNNSLLVIYQSSVVRQPLSEIDAAREQVLTRKSAAGSADALMLPTPATILPSGHVETIWDIASSPNGRWLATASHDKSVKIWESRTQKLRHTLRGHGSLVWCVAFSPDSKYVASGSGSGSIEAGELKIWEIETGHEVASMETHKRLLSDIAFHPNGNCMASASSDGTIRLWDTTELTKGTSKPHIRPLGLFHRFDRGVFGLSFSSDGKWLASAGGDQLVAVWKWKTEFEAKNQRTSDTVSIASSPDRLLRGHGAAVWSVAWSPDSRYLASGSTPGLIILWDSSTFERVAGLRADTREIRSLSFDPSGRFLAGGSLESPTVVWDFDELHVRLRDLGVDW